jgi:glycogen debranching enzyme
MSPSDQRRQEWVAKIPKLQMGNSSIERTLRRSYDDLGALRIEDPDHPERVVVAAGAPWFMTLFGRDSLWASEMALPVDPSSALGTLQTLADRQGSVVDPMSEEEPGKILHEVRLGVSGGLALGGKSAYYGSIDATPAVRDDARIGQPLGLCQGDHRRNAAPCRPGLGLDPALRRQGRRRIRRV